MTMTVNHFRNDPNENIRIFQSPRNKSKMNALIQLYANLHLLRIVEHV